ncbi:MAG: hypothetical protein IPI55_14745 [Flavobacteriales bacterium]|nr:hypothetical protein [Flavobacteriales bacterium]
MERERKRIRIWIVFFVVVLILSGLTAVPLEWGTQLLAKWLQVFDGELPRWANYVAGAVTEVGTMYPWMFYGTDWLAFAHLVIGLAFIGPLRDPVRNKWVIEWALLCCVLVVVFAFAWAPVRHIPIYWRCVDASFGVIGAIPLWFVLRDIRKVEQAGRRK